MELEILSQKNRMGLLKIEAGNFMRFLFEMAGKPAFTERMEMIKSPRFFRHMQYLQFFIRYPCDNCTRYFPGSLAGPTKK